MKKPFIFIGVFIFLIFLSYPYVKTKSEKPQNFIEEEFLKNPKNLEVIVKLKETEKQKSTFQLIETKKEELVKNITLEEYLELKDREEIEIIYNFKVEKLLDQTVPIIGATNSWNLESNGINLTGKGQTICIVDTGVDYTHPDLGGCESVGAGENCRVIGGWDFGDNDNDPKDFNNHGTHIAGIIGANGGKKGVAPESNIVAVKIFKDDGNMNSYSDFSDGISWCIEHSEEYNISVISISLGLTTQDKEPILYNRTCEDRGGFSDLTTRINSATQKGISVVVASGNEGNNTSISVPACINNSIAVTSTNKNGSFISLFSNRWNNPSSKILAAPGENIMSTNLNKGYISMEGTSMSAPHVAGAIAIINQYLNSINKTKTPLEIKDILNKTGKKFYDNSSKRDFPLIDLYSALLYLDETNPQINLLEPEDKYLTNQTSLNFTANYSDWQLKNTTLFVWHKNGSLAIEPKTENISGIKNSSKIEILDLDYGEYFWNYLTCDEKSNCKYNEKNNSLPIGRIKISIFPEKETYTNLENITLSCNSSSISEEYEIKILTLLLTNSSQEILVEKHLEESELEKKVEINYTFEQEGEYSLACLSSNNVSEQLSKTITITYDIQVPSIEVLEDIKENKATLEIISNEMINYSLYFNHKVEENKTFSKLHKIYLKELEDSKEYEYNISYCDLAKNCNFTLGKFKTLPKKQPEKESSGGVTTLKLPEQPTKKNEKELTRVELIVGSSINLKKGQLVNFVIGDENHSLSLNSIKNNSIEITIRSEEINLSMKVGEEIKLNISSREFYDFFVKLEDIKNESANITLKNIKEQIITEEEIKLEDSIDDEDNFDEPKKKKETLEKIYPLIFLIVAILVILVALKRKSRIYEERIKNINSVIREQDKDFNTNETIN